MQDAAAQFLPALHHSPETKKFQYIFATLIAKKKNIQSVLPCIAPEL
jgi:hypothetical protein